MRHAITTVALIVGDIAALQSEAIRLLRELRYFVENKNDADPIMVVVDGPEWLRVLPDELLTADWLRVVVIESTIESTTSLPAVLANRALAEVDTEWLSFCSPGMEVSTWYANKAELLAGGMVRQANMIVGYRGAGESRLQAAKSTESQMVHPDDGFSSDYPYAWLQMLDLVPMGNALLRTNFVRQLRFNENPFLQRHFWWDFTLRASAIGKIESLPLQPIPVQSWHRYPFAAPLAASNEDAVRMMMDASMASPATNKNDPQLLDDPLWNKLAESLRSKLQTARKANRGKGLRITVLGGVNEPAHNQLCFFNFFSLIQQWGVLTWRSIIDEIAHPNDLAESDLVIFSRVKSSNGMALMDFCNEKKIPTLYMLDDNWFWLGREWAEYEPLFTPGKPVYEQFMHCLKNADTVLTYNRHLADDLAPYAKRLTVLPTNVDLSCFPRKARDKNGVTSSVTSSITIGYVGSIRKNVQPFQALVEIAHARPDIKIFVMSNTLPDELKTLPADRVVFQPYQFNYAGYAATVCHAAPDVLIAPIGRNRFEASKCPNKYLEITASGAVGVYSNAPPYTDYVRENENGLFADDDIAVSVASADEGVAVCVASGVSVWRTQIERLIDDAPLRQKLAASALDDVKNQFDTRAVLPVFLEMLVTAANVASESPPISIKARLVEAWRQGSNFFR